MNDNDFVKDQSLAIIEVLKDALKAKQEQLKTMCILLVISILSNLLIVGGFLYYNSQYDYQTETVTTTTVEQETDGDSEIHNIFGDQYNDTSSHYE